MTDPALLGRLRILEATLTRVATALERLTDTVERLAVAAEATPKETTS
jgi:hypothetical protein